MMDYPVQEVIEKRRSVRTYQAVDLSPEDRAKIMSYAERLDNPFGVQVTLHFLSTKAQDQKLGTYGVIKGATTFIGVTVRDEDFALEALGYSFEKMVLYATSLGLGTCWLAGTFNRNAFTTAIGLEEGELFPVISPLGYPADGKRLTESLFRRTLGANQRKDWSTLFFEDDFDTPLTAASAGDYALPLRMLLLAPSAANKQPWRILKDSQGYHFFARIEAKADQKHSFLVQRIDLGIAACHFQLTAEENRLAGHFSKMVSKEWKQPEGLMYLFSWLTES